MRLLHVPRQEMEEQVRMGTLAIPGGAAKLRARMLRGQPRANNNGLAFLPPGALQLVPASALPAGAGGARPAQMQQMQQMRAVQNAGQQYLIAGPAQGSSTGQYTIQAIPQSSTGTFTVQQGGTTYTVQGLPAGTTYQLQAPASFSMANNSAYAMPGNMQMGMQVATASPMEARSWCVPLPTQLRACVTAYDCTTTVPPIARSAEKGMMHQQARLCVHLACSFYPASAAPVCMMAFTPPAHGVGIMCASLRQMTARHCDHQLALHACIMAAGKATVAMGRASRGRRVALPTRRTPRWRSQRSSRA